MSDVDSNLISFSNRYATRISLPTRAMVLHLVHARPIRPLPATATKPRQDPLRPHAIQLKLTEDVLALVLQRVQHGGDSGMRIVLGPTPVSL